MAIDFNTLTLGEVATIEDLSGQSIAQIADGDTPKGKALAALAMVAKRRTGEPTFKFNDALLLTLDEANELIGLNDDEDEDTDASGEAEPPSVESATD